MDPISQGALGAIAAASAAPAKRTRIATLLGWAGGMLADADVLISSESDPLLALEYHRHFTHSLFFIPIGGLIATSLLWFFLRRRIGFVQAYLFATLGYATSGLLDACTSYGTQLLWPFSSDRIAWNFISIIDPVFTGTLIVFLIVAYIWKVSGACRMALVFVVGYLMFGASQNEVVIQTVRALSIERGHFGAKRLTAKPSIGNLALWRGMYEYDGYIYVDAIRVSYLGTETRIYEGERALKVDVEALKEQLSQDSVLARDLERFARFSDGYLARHPEQSDIIGDARYAVLPDSINPLWGIEVDLEKPDMHTPFHTFRDVDQEERDRLTLMIKGKSE